jgi:hypothetical protein
MELIEMALQMGSGETVDNGADDEADATEMTVLPLQENAQKHSEEETAITSHSQPHDDLKSHADASLSALDDTRAADLDDSSPSVAIGHETVEATTTMSWNNERAAALDYVKSFQRIGRSLKFFHIPKTAGTAIEYAAGKNHLSWGSCLFNHKPKRDICRYPPGAAECTYSAHFTHIAHTNYAFASNCLCLVYFYCIRRAAIRRVVAPSRLFVSFGGQ